MNLNKIERSEIMLLNICNNPDFLSILVVVNPIITLIQIAVPLCLIIMLMIDCLKAVTNNSDNLGKVFSKSMWRLISAAMIFLVPTILEFIVSALALTDISYKSCIENATPYNITQLRIDNAEDAVALAEQEKTEYNLYKARNLVLALDSDSELKDALTLRLDAVQEIIEAEKKAGEEDKETLEQAQEPLVVTDYITAKAYSCVDNVTNREPLPSLVSAYYPSIVDKNKFIMPKDTTTGLPLGLWPKDYATIPTLIEDPEVYSDLFIWPITTVNDGFYDTVYEHNGIDLMARFGTPIYAPASGELVYSEWGHTGNRGCDETAYSVGITLDETYEFEGVEIKNIFLTHLSGIRYRCSTNKCNRRVVKGQLIGFVGNAAGDAVKPGWAPHVHISFYGADYAKGLRTSQIERMYEITSGTYRKVGE